LVVQYKEEAEQEQQFMLRNEATIGVHSSFSRATHHPLAAEIEIAEPEAKPLDVTNQ
jgi:hypothetical protein